MYVRYLSTYVCAHLPHFDVFVLLFCPDIMKGLGNSISRLRKISPKDGGVVSTETPKLEGNASVARKDSVKRRAENVSDGTNAKRRAVHESPPSTPVIKGKKKRNFFRRRQSSVSKSESSYKCIQ